MVAWLLRCTVAAVVMVGLVACDDGTAPPAGLIKAHDFEAAVRAGETQAVLGYIAYHGCDQRIDKLPLLTKIVEHGSPELLRAALDAGCDPDGAEPNETYVLRPIIVALSQDDIAGLEMLLSAGADPDPPGGMSSMMTAAASSDPGKMVDRLLAEGVPISGQDVGVLVRTGMIERLQILLDRGGSLHDAGRLFEPYRQIEQLAKEDPEQAERMREFVDAWFEANPEPGATGGPGG